MGLESRSFSGVSLHRIELGELFVNFRVVAVKSHERLQVSYCFRILILLNVHVGPPVIGRNCARVQLQRVV